ncbi:MAG: phospholipid carrier-dependent glycosyltransferase [Candidatus Peribacteraceae bacterium]|nr:phospholipid carrier-dependent glycosyltransferase [Candidatus Peribacteraceae bacterium]
MPPKTPQPWKRWHTLFLLGFVIIISYLTYFHRYTYPQAPFWDENYYITDAQREMHGMFYMQIHPPLGKLLIAWGEELAQAIGTPGPVESENGDAPGLFRVNERTDQFLSTEHADEFDKGFTFVGYRFFPVLLAWLGAPLFFLIFLFITRNPLLSGFLSFLYVFDNALIVHHRGAMLDGPMLFFVILTIVAFFLVIRTRGKRWQFLGSSALFGAALALGFTTKFQNAIMVLLVPFILWKLWKPKATRWREIGHFTWASFLAFLIFFVGVWQIHFSHMVTINPALNNGGYYQASPQYRAVVAAGKQSSLIWFPMMLRDSLTYVSEYNKGIPKLDLCKPDENGSPWFLWPVGATAINYRWETPDGNQFMYLYLVANPIVWFAGLLAVILSVVYLLMPVFSTVKPQQDPEMRFLILVFTTLYVAYMGAMSMFDRVLFLYSYFPPLIFSFVLIALILMELRVIGRLRLLEEHKVIAVGILAALIFGTHQFFRPLTYYEPLTDRQIARREWLDIWQLHCVNCGNESPMVKHRCEQ